MRFSHISLFAIILVVIAVAVAGCSDSGAKPLTSGTQAAGSSGGSTSSGSSSGSSSSGSSGSSSSAVSGSNLFGGLSYNWVEYKMTTPGANGMTIYMKYDRTTGKCSMRFEGAAAAQMPANMQNIDCSSKGGQTQSDPNKISSDAQVSCSPLDESVTVPAGTFSATKCTITAQGHTSTAWMVKGKFLVKTEFTTDQGSSSMVLNAYG